VLSGAKETIGRARRWRKMWGGGMRQGGVLAAAGLYALEHNVECLAEDHEKAKRLAQGIARCRGIDLDPDSVETNIVVFRLKDGAPAATLVEALKAEKVLILSVGPGAFRAVTHLDVPAEAIGAAVAAFERVLGVA
jgi:threonine aldolase